MNKVVEQIRGVAGVRAVLMYDRVENRVCRLMPSRYDQRTSEAIEERFKKLIDGVRGASAFNLRFSKGWLVVRSEQDYTIMIVADESLNHNTLKLVMKASLTSLRHTNSFKPVQQVASDLEPCSVEALLALANSVGEYFTLASGMGPFSTAGVFRKTKERLLEDFPILKNFSIDNNGRFGLIRGCEEKLDSTAVDAVAFWILHIKQVVSAKTPVFGFDIKDVSKDVEKELSEIGFYSAFKRASIKPVRAY